MIVKIDATVLPVPIVIDTDAKVEGASGAVLSAIKPQVSVALDRTSAPLVTWAPAGAPDPVSSALGLALVAALVGFAVLGIAATLRG